MAINFTDKCVGCGACLSKCPFGAIEMDGARAKNTAACTSCGACVRICPVEAISKVEEKKAKVMDKSSYHNVWVYMENDGESLKSVGLELLGEGRKLADSMGEALVAVIFGDDKVTLETFAGRAIGHGADTAIIVLGAEYGKYTTDAYAEGFTKLIEKHKPSVLLLGATNEGRDLGPRVACRVGTGLTADCTGLGIDEATGYVAWTRPTFGGNVLATILCPDSRPQMGTVRPGVFQRPELDKSRTGNLIRENIHVKEKDIRTKILDIVRETAEKAASLEEAEIIVAAGRGVGSKENMRLVEDLADTLGGLVGASRGAIDEGWLPLDRQIGQSGRTVSPKLYIACGISGAIQHLVGMTSSECIIAIDKDPEAHIFKVANYGIIGDLNELLPIMTEEFRRVMQGRQH